MLCLGTKYDRNEMQIKFQPVTHFCMHNILWTCILSLQDKRECIYVIHTLQSRLSFHHRCPEQIAILPFISEPSLWSQCFLCLPPHVFLFWWQHPESSSEYLSQMVGDCCSPVADMERSPLFVSTGDRQRGLFF